MTHTVEWYLYPRVCPILSLSREDLNKCIATYGRTETFTALAQIIVKNYDFPYVRACNPRVPAPPSLGPPRGEGRPTPAAATSLLGGYRCSRLGQEAKIPGITLVMKDALSRLDWSLDSFMEVYRMKCWVAIQSKTRKWAEHRSPYARATNPENLVKILDADIGDNQLLTHGILRDLFIGHCEAVPPTVEFYLQTIIKLNPTSISVLMPGYGVSLGALVCIVRPDLPCYYQLTDMSDSSAASLREFVTTSGKNLIETTSPRISDLMLIEVVPYGTHDLRAYLRDGTTYAGQLRKIIRLLQHLVEEAPIDENRAPRRIALIISLRELPALPTIEPLLLTILSDDVLITRIELVGALISNKRDYASYLILLHSTLRTPKMTCNWKKILSDKYPELLTADDIVVEPTINAKRAAVATVSEAWDVTCLTAALPSLITETSNIAPQGPRIVRGKAAFPTRTRNCTIVTETSDRETGDLMYVFGDVIEPPPPSVVVVPESPVISDPLLAKMVSGIRSNMREQKE